MDTLAANLAKLLHNVINHCVDICTQRCPVLQPYAVRRNVCHVGNRMTRFSFTLYFLKHFLASVLDLCAMHNSDFKQFGITPFN